MDHQRPVVMPEGHTSLHVESLTNSIHAKILLNVVQSCEIVQHAEPRHQGAS
jgi:hypothetical protein